MQDEMRNESSGQSGHEQLSGGASAGSRGYEIATEDKTMAAERALGQLRRQLTAAKETRRRSIQDIARRALASTLWSLS